MPKGNYRIEPLRERKLRAQIRDLEERLDALALDPSAKREISHLKDAIAARDDEIAVPDELNSLYPVNRMCFLLKRFLGAHPGFDRDDLQGYLNLFHVIANPPEDKMEKAAMVLNRAMQCPKTVRFRSFYNVKAR